MDNGPRNRLNYIRKRAVFGDRSRSRSMNFTKAQKHSWIVDSFFNVYPWNDIVFGGKIKLVFAKDWRWQIFTTESSVMTGLSTGGRYPGCLFPPHLRVLYLGHYSLKRLEGSQLQACSRVRVWWKCKTRVLRSTTDPMLELAKNTQIWIGHLRKRSEYPRFTLLLSQIVFFCQYIWTPVPCSTSVCNGPIKGRSAAPPARGVLVTRASRFRVCASFPWKQTPPTLNSFQNSPSKTEPETGRRDVTGASPPPGPRRERSTETLARTSKP